MARHRGRNAAILGGGIAAVLLCAWYFGFITWPTPAGNSVKFTGSVYAYGNSVPYGTVQIDDTSGAIKGSGALSSGVFTTGPIMSGTSYYEYFNGTSLTWANYRSVVVPAYTSVPDANSYADLGSFMVYVIATTYTDQVTDGATTAGRANGGSTATTAFTASAGVAKTYTYMITVTSTYSARAFGYMNPQYLSAGPIQGYAWLQTNSTTAYLSSGSAGTTITLASSTIFVVPISACIAGSTPASISASLGIVWPAAGHFTFQWYTVWNTNLAQLQNAKAITAPTGYTVGSWYIENGVLTVA